jgi:hypothetical protein
MILGLVGWGAGVGASVLSAIAAAVSFDVLDTRPYGTLSISRGQDMATAGVLFATGLLAGIAAARLANYRRTEGRRSDALAIVMEASGLVATGEAQQLVTEALSAELIRALDLVSCELHNSPPVGSRPSVARDGNLVGLLTSEADPPARQIDLPVWSQGEVIAHYRLTVGAKMPTREELRIALSLADQAGAAMAAPKQPLPPDHLVPLRLIPSSSEPDRATTNFVDHPSEGDPSHGRHSEGALGDHVTTGPGLASVHR